MSTATRLRNHHGRARRPQIRLADIPVRKSLPLPTVLAERTVWEARASQLENLRDYFTCALAGVTVLAAGMLLEAAYFWLLLPSAAGAAWRWAEVRRKRYRLTDRRLQVVNGVLFRSSRDTSLSHIGGGIVKVPAIQRLVGRGNVRFFCPGTGSVFTIYAAKQPHDVLLTVLAKAERMGRENVELPAE
jgi:hypothetical protein